MPKDIIKFMICAAPRTGSNMLSSLLHDHPNILCHHELYNPNGIFYALDLRNTDFSFNNMDIKSRDKYPLDFLNKIWKHPLGYTHVGFKMTHFQNVTVLDKVLRDKNILKIVLRRNNKIATHVSKLIAEQRNIWEDYGEQPAKSPELKVEVKIENLQQDIESNNSYYDTVERILYSTGQSPFYINYKSLNKSIVQRQLLSYLGCKYVPLEAKSRKQNPESLDKLISNYESLKKDLVGSELEEDLLSISP